MTQDSERENQSLVRDFLSRAVEGEGKPSNDFTRVTTWYSLQQNIIEYLTPLDLCAIYRRHLVWSKNDGDDLLRLATSRFSSSTVFLTLLVNAEISTFFSPSDIMTDTRAALNPDKEFSNDLMFAAGMTLIIGKPNQWKMLANIGVLLSFSRHCLSSFSYHLCNRRFACQLCGHWHLFRAIERECIRHLAVQDWSLCCKHTRDTFCYFDLPFLYMDG